jgi:DNA-binding protein HU-beta
MGTNGRSLPQPIGLQAMNSSHKSRAASIRELLQGTDPAAASDQLINALLNVEDELTKCRERLVIRFQSNELAPREFASELNRCFELFLEQAGSIIGPDRCRAIYDYAPGDRVDLVQPEAIESKDDPPKVLNEAESKKLSRPTIESVAVTGTPIRPPRRRPATHSRQQLSKRGVLLAIAKDTGLSNKQVAIVLDCLSLLIKRNIAKKGPGVFNIPGICKITVQHRPATKQRTGINPFTGQSMVFKAKPAHNHVRIQPLKALKEMR